MNGNHIKSVRMALVLLNKKTQKFIGANALILVSTLPKWFLLQVLVNLRKTASKAKTRRKHSRKAAA
ncbi:hypothetical protein D3C87_1328920 [compost metagenome]